MNKLFKSVAALITAMGLVFGLTSCAPEKIDMGTVTFVIDVRTQAEYQSGHLQGAINMDVNEANFTETLGKLDYHKTYVVYCHSGRRAGIAKDLMAKEGFANVINAGGIDEASAATGLPIVQ